MKHFWVSLKWRSPGFFSVQNAGLQLQDVDLPDEFDVEIANTQTQLQAGPDADLSTGMFYDGCKLNFEKIGGDGMRQTHDKLILPEKWRIWVMMDV